MTKFLIPVTVNALPDIASLEGSQGMFILPDGSININRKNGTWMIINKQSDHAGILRPADVPVIQPGDAKWYWADAGTYDHAGGVVINRLGIISYDGNNWSGIEVVLPESKIETWTAKTYVSGNQVFYEGQIYEATTSVTSIDVPGLSSKWTKKVGGDSEAVKVTFNSIVKFDEKRKYSVVNQVGNINVTYDPTGTAKDSMVKHLIISDGTSEINFSSDFEVIGLSEIDKTKNQEIIYSRPEVVEFKVPAVIMNVAKSGQITPQPEGTFEERVTQVGATLTTIEQNAWTTFKNSATTKGYYSKLISLYLCIGSNQDAKLLNAIKQAHSLTVVNLVSIDNTGLKGVFNMNLNPSIVTTNSDFSFGVYSGTNVNEPTVDMGAQITGSLQYFGIKYGSVLYAAGNDAGSGTSEIGLTHSQSSDGLWIINRSSPTSLKASRNATLLIEKTETNISQNPSLNMYLGAMNNNGTAVSASSRTYKAAFYGKGLSDTNVTDLYSDLSTFLTSIGR